MDASAITLQGLQQAEFQLNNTAAGIAAAGVQFSNSGPTDVVDLSSETVALMSSQTLYDANLATLTTADQEEQNLVDLTA